MYDKKMRIIMFGAHPDDCEIKAGGTAAKWAKLGHQVKFVSMTGGDNGHPSMAGGALQQLRRGEANAAAHILGIDAYDVLDNHGGELMPTLELRREIVRFIREWRADIVITHRNTDYHPDHRYTSILVQDAAYMVTVPFFVGSVPALERNPVFLYFNDSFQRPVPFRPDIVVSVDDVFDQKMASLEANASQMFEWMPFMLSRSSGKQEFIPEDLVQRRAWLASNWFSDQPNQDVRASLVKWYGPLGNDVKYAEAFEICEYGRCPDHDQLQELFPFFDKQFLKNES